MVAVIIGVITQYKLFISKVLTLVMQIKLFLAYRRCLAASIKGNLIPGSNEDPGGSEGHHILEILSDILSGPLQGLWVCCLTVVHIPTDTIMHVSP